MAAIATIAKNHPTPVKKPMRNAFFGFWFSQTLYIEIDIKKSDAIETSSIFKI